MEEGRGEERLYELPEADVLAERFFVGEKSRLARIWEILAGEAEELE